jgi:quercetin dioxygenase-like cupin family protein
MISRQLTSIVLLNATIFLGMARVAAQESTDKPIVSPATAAKFTALPIAPKCFTIAVEKGDPNTGPSVILARFAPGCVAPFHWHTPSETAMIVSGSLEAQMKDDKAFVGHHGDFVYFPSRHVHRATCLGAVPCLVFLTSDAAFDIHWVDAQGKEISLDEAVKAAAPASKKKAK